MSETAAPPPGDVLLAGPPPRFTSALPLWYQLAQSLRAAIAAFDRDGALRLPTEAQFARHYGVSLTTVRQALAVTEAVARELATNPWIGT